MTNYEPLPLRFKPGIQRDGTRLAAPGNWIDGEWTRFHRSLPRKIGGYSVLTSQADGIQRSFENYMNDGTHYLHMGSNSSIRQMTITDSGSAGAPVTRTPAISMSGDELWQFGTMFDPIINNAATLIAHPGRNLLDISNDTASSLYYGPSLGTSALAELTGLTPVSGGFCVVKPYVTFFGSDGYFGWSGPNKPNEMTVAVGGGENNITAQKLVAGRSVRGGNGPSGLYWSLDSLIRTSFIGGTPTWAFDTVAEDISLMSSRAIAGFGDGSFHWMGQNKFFVYANGGVDEVHNTFNSDWVFENINTIYRQKCFSFVDQRFGEVWHCFPYGSATECSHAAIYNVKEQTWYDTPLPSEGRSGCLPGNLYRYPIMGGATTTSGLSNIWQHETGANEVRGSTVYPVRSFIESSDITLMLGAEPKNKAISCVAVEPDFIQVGEMSLTITGNANSRSEAIDAEIINFDPGPAPVAEQLLRPKVERRQMRFRWESNTTDGDFKMGVPVAYVGVGSGRETG